MLWELKYDDSLENIEFIINFVESRIYKIDPQRRKLRQLKFLQENVGSISYM